MNRWLEWLLDLRDIRLGRDAPLLLRWDAAVEPWMLFAAGLIALTWVVLHCRREQVSIGRRCLLGALRCAVIALVIVALCRPTLVLQRNRVEPSYVAVLFDTSLSMAGVDTYSDTTLSSALAQGAALDDAGDVTRLSRLDLGRRILTRQSSAALEAIRANNGLQLMTFDESTRVLGTAWTDEELRPLLNELDHAIAGGVVTNLARAVQETIEGAKGRRLAAIVLVSDGRHTQLASLDDAVNMAADRQIPIYPLRLGSTDRRFDIEVGPLRTPEAVFANDIVAIEALVTATGLVEPTQVTLRLIDEENENIVVTETSELLPTVESLTVELRVKPGRTGRVTYRVEAIPLDGELSESNNADRIATTVLNERANVLYVEGYPRYEYRYLKNALVREPTISISVLLIEADEQFVQEGTDPIRRFPETPEELERYDVVLFGDVNPRDGWLSSRQQEMLVDFVARHGGGFGLIAGERSAPRYFDNTALERLVPVRIDPTFLGKYEASLSIGFSPRLTPAGRSSRLFRFSVDRAANERTFAALPELFWFARTLGPRPAATGLTEHPSLQSAYGSMPLIVTGQYGAGKLYFQATDDTWRWRRRDGETLHDAFWVQVVRSLMRTDRGARDRMCAITTDRRSYAYGQPVRIRVELLDPSLRAAQQDTLDVAVSTLGAEKIDTPGADGDPSQAPPGSLMSNGGLARRITAHRISEQTSIYEASFVPSRPGRYAFELADTARRPGESNPAATVRVQAPDLEFRRPEADHEWLERIAVATQGRMIEPDAVVETLSTIRNRSAQIPDDITEPLWDSKLIFGLFVLMISTEWVLRKAFGLV